MYVFDPPHISCCLKSLTKLLKYSRGKTIRCFSHAWMATEPSFFYAGRESGGGRQ